MAKAKTTTKPKLKRITLTAEFQIPVGDEVYFSVEDLESIILGNFPNATNFSTRISSDDSDFLF